MKSHVQLPYFILKRFAHRKKTVNDAGFAEYKFMVYCLNLKTRAITEEDIKELNVIRDYFTDEVEKILGNTENEFGELISKIEKQSKTDFGNFDLEPYEKIIKKFFYFEMARSDTVAKKTKEKSILRNYFRKDSAIRKL